MRPGWAADPRRALSARATDLGPRLLGAVVVSDLVGERVAVRLSEVEAYEGPLDAASHAFRGPTPRTAVMFGPPAHLYVYFVYGMHWCANIVCGPDGTASAVLLRAGQVTDGIGIARERRPAARSDDDLARGPARLARCLGLTRAQNGLDLLAPDAPVRLTLAVQPSARVAVGPRVGVAAASTDPLRFWLEGDPTVSTYRSRAARRRARPAAALGPHGRLPS